MSHSHGSSGSLRLVYPGWVRLGLVLAIGLLALATLVGLRALWPSAEGVAAAQQPANTEGVTRSTGTVVALTPLDCPLFSPMMDGATSGRTQCLTATVAYPADGPAAQVDLDLPAHASRIAQLGDDLTFVAFGDGVADPTYQFLDFARGDQLLLLGVAFGVLIVGVAGRRGIAAILGLGATLFLLVRFMLPALLAGEDALQVVVVGATAMVLVALYLAHGISVRTTAALLGTVGGLAMATWLGSAMTDWARLTGVASEDDLTLVSLASQLDLATVVSASMVVAALGVLNDVTITQASAVWELRAHEHRVSRLFTQAMRIGRDHIASSVYTLVFAYAGGAMGILLLIEIFATPYSNAITSEDIGAELVRTFVGGIALVLAVPFTTAIAAVLAARGQPVPPADESPADPALSTAAPR